MPEIDERDWRHQHEENQRERFRGIDDRIGRLEDKVQLNEINFTARLDKGFDDMRKDMKDQTRDIRGFTWRIAGAIISTLLVVAGVLLKVVLHIS